MKTTHKVIIRRCPDYDDKDRIRGIIREGAEELGAAFRDRVLLRFPVGRDFVESYYHGWGPGAADWIEGNDTARLGARIALTIIAVPLKVLLFGRLSLLVLLFACALAGYLVGRRLGWKRSTALAAAFSVAFTASCKILHLRAEDALDCGGLTPL